MATKIYTESIAANGASLAKLHVAETLHAHFSPTPNAIAMFSEAHDKTFATTIIGSSPCEVYSTVISICCVGNDPGLDIPVNLKGLVERTYTHMSDVLHGSKGVRVH